MKLRLLIFSICYWFAVAGLKAQDATPVASMLKAPTSMRDSLDYYHKRVLRTYERWISLIPNIGTVQVAGNIGVLSVGAGWDYGKNDRWETHAQFGLVPKDHNERAAFTFTLRENLVPWSFGLGHRRWAAPQSADTHIAWNRRAAFSFEPAVFSFFANTIFNDEFWVKEPEKYNSGNYYRFSSKVRLHLGFGSRISLNIPEEKRRRYDRVSFYYELSSYDLAIISAVPNKDITLGDILCLGFGIQYKFF